MIAPTYDPARAPDALVVVASPSLGATLRRVRDGGWAGPVVVVGSVSEATALARPLRPATGTEQSSAGSGAHRDGPAPVRAQLVLDPDRRTVASDGRWTALTPLEYDVLHALLAEPGRVRPFAELTEQVWGTPYDGDTTQVHSVVKRVRRKLDSIASPVRVQAVRGVGFRAVVGTTRRQGP